MRAGRRPFIWLCVSLGCIVITNVYALFGHGIRSDAMDYMFLYPLLGGAAVMLLLDVVFRRLCYPRLALNLHSAGIATLTVGGMVQGILDIAGTASAYTIVFTVAGWMLVGVGLIAWCADALRFRQAG